MDIDPTFNYVILHDHCIEFHPKQSALERTGLFFDEKSTRYRVRIKLELVDACP